MPQPLPHILAAPPPRRAVPIDYGIPLSVLSGGLKAPAEPDALLTSLADEIDRTLDGAAYALEPVADEDDQERRLRKADDLLLRMVSVPAAGFAGVKAKAKSYLDSFSYDVNETCDLARSLAQDVERVCGWIV